MGDLDAPPGDPTAIRTAATALGTLANDLHGRTAGVTKGCHTAISDWKGKRATDFKRAALTVEDEVSQAESVMSQAAAALNTYATALETAQTAVATASTRVSNAESSARTQSQQDPDNAIDYHRGAVATIDSATNDATDAKATLRRAVQQLVTSLDSLTRQIVARDAKLDPNDVRRAVDETMGGPVGFYSQYSTDGLYSMFGVVQGGVFSNAPKPDSPRFAAWFASLDPLQKELATQSLNSQFSSKDFNPYATIKPGQLPPWAVAFNARYSTIDNRTFPAGQGPYGYFGGGTVMGPGGVQWPIVMPYVTGADGNVYMNEEGPIGPDGGIEQLDGKDGGWSTVAQYRGVSQYGTVSGTTKFIVVGENFTGQELEVNETDPHAVEVDSHGMPSAGSDRGHGAEAPIDKPYWDVQQAANETDEIAKGSTALGVQLGQAAAAQHALDSHAQRRYFIDYQVNTDGRTRAVVHTYTTTQNEEGKTVVGSFANGFPDGKGSTNEIAYNTRHNPEPKDRDFATPDPDVDYTGFDPDDPLDTSSPINDPLNR